jgi:hypothetical protein
LGLDCWHRSSKCVGVDRMEWLALVRTLNPVSVFLGSIRSKRDSRAVYMRPV